MSSNGKKLSNLLFFSNVFCHVSMSQFILILLLPLMQASYLQSLATKNNQLYSHTKIYKFHEVKIIYIKKSQIC